MRETIELKVAKFTPTCISNLENQNAKNQFGLMLLGASNTHVQDLENGSVLLNCLFCVWQNGAVSKQNSPTWPSFSWRWVEMFFAFYKQAFSMIMILNIWKTKSIMIIISWIPFMSFEQTVAANLSLKYEFNDMKLCNDPQDGIMWYQMFKYS